MKRARIYNREVSNTILHRVGQLGECSPLDVWRVLVDEGHPLLKRWSSEHSARSVIRTAMVRMTDSGELVRVGQGRYMTVHEARQRGDR